MKRRKAAHKRAALVGALLFFAAVSVGLVLLYTVCIPKKYADYVESAADEFSLESELLYAVMRAESSFDASAVSPAGAVGLMQIMPSTARFIVNCMGEDADLFDPADNIRMGAWYLAYLAGKFPSLPLCLAAYNAGEGTVRRWLEEGTVSDGACTEIPYAETAAYVRRVKKFYKLYDFFYI